MATTRLVAYRDAHGRAPLRDWLDGLPQKARDRCLVRLERLEKLGHELRRPEADYLRDDIHELRTKHLKMNYRMLYFFHGPQVVVLSHGFAKQQAKVPTREIDLAVQRKRNFEEDPTARSFDWMDE